MERGRRTGCLPGVKEMPEDLTEKLREFEKESQEHLVAALKLHQGFLELYPFRDRPEEIETLTPELVYNPGAGSDYFLRWIEFKLKNLGRIAVGNAQYAENARDDLLRFKELLRAAVDDSLTIAEKVDAHWEDIKGFGGDRMIAKKIVYCYYPERVLPVYKTEHLEHFARQLHIDYATEAYERYGKPYEALSVGQKWECLSALLLQAAWGRKEPTARDTLLLARYLYEIFPPQKLPPATRKVEPLHPLGILFEPEYEQEVVYLFSVFHRDLGFPYVVKIRNEFPDAVVMDKKREVRTVEFEVRGSDFVQHGHPKKGCDFIVCWENDLEPDEDLPAIISLKDFVKEL